VCALEHGEEQGSEIARSAELTVAGHRRADIWVNVLNAPDGGWGIAGRAYTGEDLIGLVSAAV
jgi:hypothetical protein